MTLKYFLHSSAMLRPLPTTCPLSCQSDCSWFRRRASKGSPGVPEPKTFGVLLLHTFGDPWIPNRGMLPEARGLQGVAPGCQPGGKKVREKTDS